MLFVTVTSLLLPAYTEKKPVFCGIDDHEHTLACYADPDADVETEAVWAASIPAFAADQSVSERLVQVARSQLGYRESEKNYIVSETGEVSGYSRYGAFVKTPYAPWNAAFAEFCLRYAGVNAGQIPTVTDTSGLQLQMQALGQYEDHRNSPYIAYPGDLVFFRGDSGELCVGIVTNADRTGGDMTVVAGDQYGEVREMPMAFTEGRLLGFGRLPKELRPPEPENEESPKESLSENAAGNGEPGTENGTENAEINENTESHGSGTSGESSAEETSGADSKTEEKSDQEKSSSEKSLTEEPGEKTDGEGDSVTEADDEDSSDGSLSEENNSEENGFGGSLNDENNTNKDISDVSLIDKNDTEKDDPNASLGDESSEKEGNSSSDSSGNESFVNEDNVEELNDKNNITNDDSVTDKADPDADSSKVKKSDEDVSASTDDPEKAGSSSEKDTADLADDPAGADTDEDSFDADDPAVLARALAFSFYYNTSDSAAGYVYMNSKSYGESITLAVMNDGLSAGTVRPRSSGAPTNGKLSASNGYDFHYWRIDGYQYFGRGAENPASTSDLYSIRPKVGDAYVSGNAHTFTACFAPTGQYLITFDRYVGADPQDNRVYGSVSAGSAKSYTYLDEYGNTQSVYFCYSGAAGGMEAHAFDEGVFVGWYEAGTENLICETPSFVPPGNLTGDITVQAHFRKANTKTVTYVSYNSRTPSAHGGMLLVRGGWWTDYTVTEWVLEGRVPNGATALPIDGMTFIGWRDADGNLLTREADLTLDVHLFEDLTYRAEYLETKYARVLFRSSDKSSGRVKAGDADWTDTLQGYNRNSSGNLRLSQVVSAVPEEGYRFDHWELNGQRFVNDTRPNLRDLSVPPDASTSVQELTAIFIPICQVTYDLSVTRQIGNNDAAYQHWQDVPWCPNDAHVLLDGLTQLGEDVWQGTIDYGATLTFPEVSQETRVSQTNNGYNLLTSTFKGWFIDGDSTWTLYSPGQTITVDRSIRLVADWDAYFDGKTGYYGAESQQITRYNTNTCGFFVRLFDSEFDIGDVGTYTDCLFTTRLIGDPLYAGNGSRDDFSGDSVAELRSDIDRYDAYLRENAASGIKANEDSAFAGAIMKLELPFPSDEFIFGRIRMWNADQPEEHKIQINGHIIPQEQLTGDYYDLRWYVLKDQENSWHIDGMLIPKYAKLVVMKSFAGEPAAIEAVTSGNFYIGVDENRENTLGNGLEQYRLNLRPWSSDNPTGYRYIDGRGQYVWVLDGLLPLKSYWVAEHGYTAPAPYSTFKSYVVSNTSQKDTSGSGNLVGVEHVYSYADEVWVDGIQTVAFTNRYTKPRELTLIKLDQTTQRPLSDVPFRLVLYADQGDGQIVEIPLDARTDKDGRISVTFTEEMEIEGQTVRIPSYQPGGFHGRHRFTVTEGANEGYEPLASSITGYVTFYDDREATITLDDTTNPLVQVATEGDGSALLMVTNRPELLEVSVRKTWPDGGDRPVNMQLLRNDVPWIGKNVTLGTDASRVQSDPEHNTEEWSYTWRELPGYIDGEKVVYTVREEWIGLPGGTDSVHYNSASDADGYFDYIVNQSQVTEGSGNIQVYVENTPDGGQVVFSKVDDLKRAVAGAEFTVFKNSSASIPISEGDFREGTDKERPAVFVSDENGIVTVNGLKSGTYYLRETKAPLGYTLEDTRILKLTIRAANSALTDMDTGKSVTSLKNPIYTASVTILKAESGTGKLLSGAVFSLHSSRADGTMNTAPMRGYEELVTGTDGRVALGKLRRGIYYLVEETAPPGFEKLDEPIRLTVPESGATKISAIKTESNTGLPVSGLGEITVANSRGIVLPETGSREEERVRGAGNAVLLPVLLLWGLWFLWNRKARKPGGGDSRG